MQKLLNQKINLIYQLHNNISRKPFKRLDLHVKVQTELYTGINIFLEFLG